MIDICNKFESSTFIQNRIQIIFSEYINCAQLVLKPSLVGYKYALVVYLIFELQKFIKKIKYNFCSSVVAVAQWLRLELRYERCQVRSPLYIFWFGRNLALHHINVLALCCCLVSNSRIY